MRIRRIDGYDDKRFSKEVLLQHGAYIIDEKYPCEILINGKNSAIIYYHDYRYVDNIIKVFRYYSRNITKFYGKNKRILRRYKDIPLYKYDISKLQPSQFYIDELKMKSILSWIQLDTFFVIPIIKCNNKVIVIDGHTRLYLANQMGIDNVYIYEERCNKHILKFVEEAIKRNIYCITDLQVISHDIYDILWYDYCDDYINRFS